MPAKGTRHDRGKPSSKLTSNPFTPRLGRCSNAWIEKTAGTQRPGCFVCGGVAPLAKAPQKRIPIDTETLISEDSLCVLDG